MRPARPLLVAIAVLASLSVTRAQDNPQATSGSWRPTIVAQHGMVAAGHPLAAEAGLRILKAGGNAIDAAIATWAVQGEVEPGMTGLGAVGGAAFAVKKYGTKTLADVLAPAIEIADQGFPITESLARGLAGSKDKL